MPIFFSTLIFYYSSLIIIIIISNKFFYFPNKNITFHFHPSKNPRPYCNETMHNFPANISTSLIFQFPNSFTSKRRGEKKTRGSRFRKGDGNLSKDNVQIFRLEGRKGEYLPTISPYGRPLNKVSKMSRAFTERSRKFGGKNAWNWTLARDQSTSSNFSTE